MSTSSNSSRFRTFGDTFGKGAPAFIHVADTGTTFTDADGNLISGAWRPAVPADFQSPAANVNVSGLSLSVGAVAITGVMPTQTVAITGNPTVVVSGFNPIWVTGTFATNSNTVTITGALPTHPVSVTGNTSITGSVLITNGILPVSGNVSILGTVQTTLGTTNVAVTGNPTVIVSGFNPIWVTGSFSTTVNSVAVTGNPGMTVTGFNTGITVAVSNATEQGQLNITNALLTGISGLLQGNLTDVALVKDATGQLYLAAISGLLSSNATAITGNPTVVVSGFNPIWVTGTFSATVNSVGITGSPIITTINSGSSSINNAAPSGAYPYTSTQFFFGQALAANANRLEMFVQNTHTGIPLYVRLHTGAASTGAFSMILNPSTVQGWGGSSFGSSRYKGAVQVSGGSWIAWETN